MNKLLGNALLATSLALVFHAAAAEDVVRENRTVDAKVTKVRLGGVVRLNLRQGPPSLVVSGDRRYIGKIKTVQNGDTLTIDLENNTRIQGNIDELRADLSVPNLQEFVSQGVGSSEVSGFKGDKVKLALDGAGAVRFTGQYREVDARLGGVGGLTLNPGQSDRIALELGGAGHITVSGQTKLLRAHMGGIGGLDAQQLRAETVELDMNGLGGASVFARNAANVSLNGMGSATVYGNPATRRATTSGFGKVSWQQ
ncbi:GIN domain-containing protein [Massilia sp. TN1-12]|uniref:GIN domain-containing protein n=1 Tax=Massilia paldalensis TaxID=3377675 RepID=UPI003850B587